MAQIGLNREAARADGVFLAAAALDPGDEVVLARGIGGGGGCCYGDFVAVAVSRGDDLEAAGGRLEAVLERPEGGGVIVERASPLPRVPGTQRHWFLCRHRIRHACREYGLYCCKNTWVCN